MWTKPTFPTRISPHFETYSILLSLLLSPPNSPYTQALINSAPVLPPGQDGHKYYSGNYDGFAGLPETHPQQLHMKLAQLSLKFTSPLSFYFATNGLQSSLDLAYWFVYTSQTQPRSFTFIEDMVKSCLTNDDVNLFIPALSLAFTTSTNGSKLYHGPQTHCYKSESDLILSCDMVLRSIPHCGCAQILNYIITTHHNAILDHAQSSPNLFPRKLLLQLVFERTHFPRGERLSDPNRFIKTATHILSLDPVRNLFIKSALEHYSDEAALVEKNADSWETEDYLGHFLEKTTIFNPALSVINSILAPIITNPVSRFRSFQLSRYFSGLDGNDLGPMAIPRLRASFAFVLGSILIPLYQSQSQGNGNDCRSDMRMGEDDSTTPTTLTTTPSQQQQQLSSSSSPTIIHTPPTPNTPFCPYQFDPSPEFPPTPVQFGWYYMAKPLTYSVVDCDGQKIFQSLRKMMWADSQFKFPLIFLLLSLPTCPTDPVNTEAVFFDELMKRRAEYPISLNHVLRHDLVDDDGGDDGENGGLKPCPITTPIKSLTPLQFAVLRWTFHHRFERPILPLQAVGYGQTPLVAVDCQEFNHEGTFPPFLQHDLADSKMVSFLIDYFIEAIIDNTIDLHHPHLVTSIKTKSVPRDSLDGSNGGDDLARFFPF